MESKQRKEGLILLPAYFKTVGVIIAILAFLVGIVTKSAHVELGETQRHLFRLALILGLLILAWSRDKVEDEMTVFIRLKCMSLTFVSAVVYVILTPLIDLFFKDPMGDISGQQLVMTTLSLYLVFYYLGKNLV